MSPPKHSPKAERLSPPAIRIQSASPELPLDQPPAASPEDTKTGGLIPRRTRSLPCKKTAHGHRHRRKRSATTAQLPATLGSDSTMAGGSRSTHSTSRKHSSSSSSSKRSKSSPKDLDWSHITDPEERRRIQNRLAQRKFREKIKESKEKSERDSRNQEYAGNSYRIPSPGDFTAEHDLSGLPWGGVNLGLFLSRGHELEGRRSSGRGTHVGEDGSSPAHYGNPYGDQLAQSGSLGGSSGGDEVYFDDTYLYDPTGQDR